MHRDAAAVGAAAAFTVLLLASASPAAADPADGGSDHATEHATERASDGEVAEWPEWATVDGGDEQGSDEHADHSPEPGLTEPDHDEGTHEDEGSHNDEGAVTPDRPRAQVLGSFAAVNGGVLLTAAIWRRRTKGEVARRRSARAAALHGTTGDR